MGVSFRRTLLAVAALALGGSSCEQSSAQTPGAICPTIVHVVTWTMTSPASGATGVPVTVGSIVVPADGLAASQAHLVLTPSIGAPVSGGTFQATANGTETASVPTLTPNTTYSATASSGGRCPGETEWTLGSFTTG